MVDTVKKHVLPNGFAGRLKSDIWNNLGMHSRGSIASSSRRSSPLQGSRTTRAAYSHRPVIWARSGMSGRQVEGGTIPSLSRADAVDHERFGL